MIPWELLDDGSVPGDVLEDEEGMNNMKNLGETMAWLMKALETAGE